MPQFQQPPRGAGSPKIPRTVPLTQAPADKQETYTKLAELGEIQEEPIVDTVEWAPAHAAELKEEPEPRHIPTEEDRQAFMSSLMGGNPYTKIFALYNGAITATFEDRSVEVTETIYRDMNAHGYDDEEYSMWLDRLFLTAQLVSLDGNPVSKDWASIDRYSQSASINALRSRCVDKILKLPRPIYHALMEALRTFENEVSYMVEHALDPDFWKPGGPDSPSPRSAKARSTTAGIAATTPIGR